MTRSKKVNNYKTASAIEEEQIAQVAKKAAAVNLI